MFFQKDYILRMIEMVGEVMRRVGEMLDDLQRFRLLDDACRQHCGMDLDAARNLDIESLIDLLAPQPRLMMAEILYIQAIQTSLKDEERERLLYRSGRLLISLRSESLLCELRHHRLSECIEGAGELFSARDRLDAAAFFMQADQFAKGEDQLYEALESSSSIEHASFLDESEALLKQCLTMPHDRLQAGGLPYDEVLESIRALSKRKEAHQNIIT